MGDTDNAVLRTVDWKATAGAALTAGLLSLPLYLFFVPAAVGNGNVAVVLRYLASIVMGPAVLPPPETLAPLIAIVAILVHFALAALMTAMIAFVLHRWGLIVGIAGGAALGLAFFAINYYSLTAVFPQFHAMGHWSVAVTHLIFGAVAGGVYELLEVDPPELQAGEG